MAYSLSSLCHGVLVNALQYVLNQTTAFHIWYGHYAPEDLANSALLQIPNIIFSAIK